VPFFILAVALGIAWVILFSLNGRRGFVAWKKKNNIHPWIFCFVLMTHKEEKRTSMHVKNKESYLLFII
jgi:tryptophan-rich sensory protein